MCNEKYGFIIELMFKSGLNNVQRNNPLGVPTQDPRQKGESKANIE